MEAPAPKLLALQGGHAPFTEEEGLAGQEGTGHKAMAPNWWDWDLNANQPLSKDTLFFVSSLDLHWLCRRHWSHSSVPGTSDHQSMQG